MLIKSCLFLVLIKFLTWWASVIVFLPSVVKRQKRFLYRFFCNVDERTTIRPIFSRFFLSLNEKGLAALHYYFRYVVILEDCSSKTIFDGFTPSFPHWARCSVGYTWCLHVNLRESPVSCLHDKCTHCASRRARVNVCVALGITGSTHIECDIPPSVRTHRSQVRTHRTQERTHRIQRQTQWTSSMEVVCQQWKLPARCVRVQ